ncbi:MAG TPA: aldehyde dehydrogenase family protein [Solirubrobacteraceae bacterium]|nr:aldehyde dehydrogenase family protein [Solirubrobacteraceae bacterium]
MASTTIPTQVHDRLYIGGEWISPVTTDAIDVVNPFTEQTIGRIPAGGAGDVDRAVAAARAALDGWAATPAAERAELLSAIAERLAERGDELALTISSELGMPIGLARLIQVGLPTMSFQSMAGLLDELAPEEIGNSLVVREPLGVVAAIAPWNYPLHQIAAKVAPALAAGCTVVLKPSEITPLCAFVMAEICDEVGLPAGVLNVVTGYGPVVGDALIGHPDVDLVTFTGSERVGRHIGEVAGRNLVPAALELGGKSACVVLDDADMQLAVATCVTRCMINSGQTCIALTRLLVPRARLAEAEAIAAAVAAAHTLGDPLDHATQLGPLVSAEQRDRVREHIRRALAQGARLVCGGADAPAGHDRGYFVAPTVLSDVRSDMAIAQEEVFGPVLSIIAHDGEEDAVRIANDSRYGLSGAVWSADEARALRVARRIRAGQVDVNGGAFNPCAPFGGVGCSGHGRELGAHGLREFVYLKSIQL